MLRHIVLNLIKNEKHLRAASIQNNSSWNKLYLEKKLSKSTDTVFLSMICGVQEVALHCVCLGTMSDMGCACGDLAFSEKDRKGNIRRIGVFVDAAFHL